MKPLNTIVADLEYCKELKELGVKQKSIFYWIFNSEGWKLTELDVGEGGSDYEWLQSRGKLSEKSKIKMGIGIGIYHGLRKETYINLGLTEDEYNKRLNESYSAWTASELFEMLPDKTKCYRTEFQSGDMPYSQYTCVKEAENLGKYYRFNHDENADSAQDSMAKVLIYLLKNNIISLEEVNKNI